MRLHWLNGWPRLGDSYHVLIGTGMHCIGCGRFHGLASVALDGTWTPPGRSPDWPFEEADCPVCALERLQVEVEPMQRALARQERFAAGPIHKLP